MDIASVYYTSPVYDLMASVESWIHYLKMPLVVLEMVELHFIECCFKSSDGEAQLRID